MSEPRRRTFCRPQSLEELMTQDPHGLLAAERLPKVARTVTRTDRIGSHHKEIYDFIREHGRLPAADASTRSERSLASRLSSLQSSSPADYRLLTELAANGTEAAEQLEQMAPGLSISRGESLQPQEQQQPPVAGPEVLAAGSGAARPRAEATPETEPEKEDPDAGESLFDEELVLEDIDDLLNNDPLGLLSGVAAAPPDDSRWREGRIQERGSSRSLDNIIARATACPDFYRYRRFFDEVAGHLEQGTLNTQEIVGSSGSINVGDIFVLGGITALVAGAEVAPGEYKDASSRSYRKERLRLDLIYDNGKQSNITAEALRSSFYKDQVCLRVVAASPAGSEYLEGFRHELQQLREGRGNNVISGYLYVLTSRSTDPRLQEFTANSSLVKIGATTTSVEQRIANAENEDTYLFAKVRLAAQFKCYNDDPFALERIVHTHLHSHRLNVELTDSQGRRYRPREWFTVSAETASEVVRHVIADDMRNFRIDPVRGQLRRKAGAKP